MSLELENIIQATPQGLYCPEGDFHIDPRRPVSRAVITHAHADHARPGSETYLCAAPGKRLLKTRLGQGINVQALDYGESLKLNGVEISLHPAGHILGSAQVRIDQQGRVCVVSGDYKAESDPTCEPLEPLTCHVFVSETTFGLPVFRWPSQTQVSRQIQKWWHDNQKQDRTSVLFAYSLGKAQRILAALDNSQGPILTHGAVEKMTQIYRKAGIALPSTRYIGDVDDRRLFQKSLVVAPPSADHGAWLKRFPRRSRAFASGWMRIRGNRRRRAVDRGFVLSDHSDWTGLLETINATGAEQIGLTHGYGEELARWLRDQGYQAGVIPEVGPRSGISAPQTPVGKP